jgi:hypothetical protein
MAANRYIDENLSNAWRKHTRGKEEEGTEGKDAGTCVSGKNFRYVVPEVYVNLTSLLDSSLNKNVTA